MENLKKNVVIVGAGFAGLSAAKLLGNHEAVEVFVIDRRNHHLFQPLLYQVALAALSPADIAVPIRSELARFDNIHVHLAAAQSVDFDRQCLSTDIREFPFDYLVLACGANHSYFGKNQWENDAPGLKTLEQATEIRRRVLLAFEKAESSLDPEEKAKLLTFVIVGGGPTGVELAGAIAEISHQTLTRDFDHIDSSTTSIHLVEAGDRILPGFPRALSEQAQLQLQDLGVKVSTNFRVTAINDQGVTSAGSQISAATVIWAAGIAPSPLNKTLSQPLDPSGRVFVGEDLTLPSYQNIFVVGDQAHAKDRSGVMLPGLAPVAMQQGRYVSQCILNDLSRKPREPFRYRDKGLMATIGRKKAIAYFRGFNFTGILAWWMWLLVHIHYLIGFRNKLSVLFSWTWSYLTYKKAARLILSKSWRAYTDKNPDDPTS